VCFSLAQIAPAQLARKAKKEGPRALGLVELSADGKARLIPVCIMVDGKFYDAGAYKASPVPLSLWTGTVYEGEKTGVPQGLFTVAEAGHTGNDVWFGVGKWVPAGSEPKARSKGKEKVRDDTKPRMEDDEGPPKLRRADSSKPSEAGTSSANTATPAQSDNTSATPTTEPPASSTAQKSAAGNAASSPAATQAENQSDDSAASASNDEDPNRPILKRGKPETAAAEHPKVGASTGVPRRPGVAAATADTKRPSLQLVPAISDAGGPDPRPYAYDLKTSEEEKYRKGMLALAADALAAKLRDTVPAGSAGATPKRTPIRRPPPKPQPAFEDVQFRAFDLSNTNEPVFVLSATAKPPATASASSTSASSNYYVTIVAKNNIYDELRRLYAGVTDARSLDQTPRLELIDAVDADGDGRGELLFRTTCDAGKAWAVYRAGADQLLPLFEGTPPENKPVSQE